MAKGDRLDNNRELNAHALCLAKVLNLLWKNNNGNGLMPLLP